MRYLNADNQLSMLRISLFIVYICLLLLAPGVEAFTISTRRHLMKGIHAALTSPAYPKSTSSSSSTRNCKILVMGVGGGGGNAVTRVMKSNSSLNGVDLWAVNTDSQALQGNLATNKLNIGTTLTRYISTIEVILDRNCYCACQRTWCRGKS